MSIAIENLPSYEQISSEPIRSAVAALSAAKGAADEAKKTHIQLEQELPNAHQQDAAADERLRAEGKPKLKGRPATQAAEKGIAEAAHEQLVCELAVGRARDELVASLAEHGEAWAAEVAESVEALSREWVNTVEGMIGLHGKLTAAVSVARGVGIGKVPQVGSLPFSRRQIDNAEFASPQPDQPAYIGTPDVLAALARVVQPEPDAEKAPVTHAQWRYDLNPLRGRGDVEGEIAEREAFHEPERVAARRSRAEQNRQAGQEAQQTLTG